MAGRRKLQIQKVQIKLFDRIILLAVCIFIVIGLFTFKAYTYSSKENQLALIRLTMNKMSENQKIQFENYINDKIDVLKALVTFPDIYEMDRKRQKEIMKGRSNLLGFEHIFILDNAGMGYYIDEDVYRDQKYEEFFADVMGQDLFVTEPFYSEDGRSLMTVCVSIYGGKERKEKVGVLCGAVSLESIQKLLENNEMILDGQCVMLNREGHYMTSADYRDIYNQVSIYDTEDSEFSLIREAFREKRSREGTIRIQGQEYQACVTYLEEYDWVMLQSVPTSAIVERYHVMDSLQKILGFFIFILILCSVRIILSWRKSDKKIYTDALTKCNNRAACLSLLEYLEKKRRQKITIIYMDLNKFKFVNDTYGHDKGDELLCIFSKVLMNVFGQESFVGRMGGDEFISILLNTTEEEIQELWEQVEEQLKQHSQKLDFSYEISSSYGYATREKGGKESLKDILQKADENMYKYKTAHKKP